MQHRRTFSGGSAAVSAAARNINVPVFNNAAFARPPVAWRPGSNLEMQIYDCSQESLQPVHGVSGPSQSTYQAVPEVMLYGTTRDGNSVLLRVMNFEPYLWVQAPESWVTGRHEEPFVKHLNDRLKGMLKTPNPIVRVETHRRRSLMYCYKNAEKNERDFLKIVVQMPGNVPAVKNLFINGFECEALWVGTKGYLTYESNVLFPLRFLVDRKIGGCNWITVDGDCLVRPLNFVSNSQIELFVTDPNAVVGHEPLTDRHSLIAPFRVLSFDIECLGRKGFFPEPEQDPVIQIANYCQIYGSDDEALCKVIFTLNTCAPVAGAEVRCFQTEAELLLAWQQFLVAVDPEILTGYNISGFDMMYLLKRSKALGIEGRFAHWSRHPNRLTECKEKQFASKQMGARNYFECNVDGRIALDVLTVMQRDYKLRSYSLNNVSQEFLGEQKEDVHHSIIGELQNGTDETRHRLAVYCFPAADTRVLTSLGFLFLDQIEALEPAQLQELRYAAYDLASKKLLYVRGRLVIPDNQDKTLVEFTNPAEGERWSTKNAFGHKEDSDHDGKCENNNNNNNNNQLSIRVTPGHTMYMREGTEKVGEDASGVQWHKIGFRKQTAEQVMLVPEVCKCSDSDCEHRRRCVGMMSCAENGIDVNVHTLHLHPATELLLDTEEKVYSFLEVYGLWLGDGCLAVDQRAGRTLTTTTTTVNFSQVKASDTAFLDEYLPRCGLQKNVDWTEYRTSTGQFVRRITNKLWVNFFKQAYLCKYARRAGRRANRADGDDDDLDIEAIREQNELETTTTATTTITTINIKSVKWFPWWVLKQLSKLQLRRVIDGLRRADGCRTTSNNNNNNNATIFTSSVQFRDQLMIALLHAGYAPHFTCLHTAGTVTGYLLNGVIVDKNRAGDRDVKPIVANDDQWAVAYAEPTNQTGKWSCLPTMKRNDVKSVPHEGRVWCVEVEHADHLIVAQRARRSRVEPNAVVTMASKPVIIGNCLKDAYLPIRLIDKLMIVVNNVEMARVTGVPIPWLLERGQQIKVFSQILRKACGKLLFPAHERHGGAADGVGFEGATVIAPEKGFYDTPIATLDFASLYPSLIQAHNLCYSTLIPKQERANFTADEVTVSPTGDWFVSDSIYKGILPEILTDLLTARKAAKKAMNSEADPRRKAVYNGRQLALKISANSVYGFTGALNGKLPCLEISASVTSFGRQLIERTKQLVEANYEGVHVIYGDTDSVMVRCAVPEKGDDKAKLTAAMEWGPRAAAFITTHFKAPIKLEFEKVYFPYLLMNKKRYAGLYWTNADKYDKLDAKGIELVRRDNCMLVSTLLSGVLNRILIQRSVESAKEYAKGIVSDLLMNRVDISNLVVSKALAASYANKQAHAELAARMRKRDPASAPSVGDRVAYVMLRGEKGSRAYENAEDPIYALENNLPIDYQYYVEHFLTGPLQRVFEAVMDDPTQLVKGDHTRHITVVAPSAKGGGMMGKFIKVKKTCLGCRASVEDNAALCKTCEARAAEIYSSAVAKRNHFESIYSRVWTQCQQCQTSLHQEVICSNRDCPVFYMRKKVEKDLKESQDTLDRFGIAIPDW